MALSFTVTTEDVSYYPADVPIPTVNGGAFAANQGPYLNYYRGISKPGPKGRPCFVEVSATTRRDGTLSTDPSGAANQVSSFAAEMLARGCSHISASLTLADTSDPYTAYVSGAVTHSGLIHPKGISPSGLGLEPYTHVNYTFSYKDAILLVQYLKKNAKTYEIDPDRIFLYGSTAAAHAVQYACYRERALDLGAVATDAQYGFSTRVAGLFLDIPRINWNLMDQTTAGSAISFPDEANPDDDWTSPAATAADIPDEHKNGATLIGNGTIVGYGDSDIIRSTPLYLSTGIAAIAAETAASNSVIGPPFIGATASEPLHSAWSCSVLRRFVDRAPCRFAAGGTVAAAIPASVANEDMDYTSDTAATQRAQLVADWVAWAERYLLAGKPAVAARS